MHIRPIVVRQPAPFWPPDPEKTMQILRQEIFQRDDMPDYVYMIRTFLHMISGTLFASRKRQVFREIINWDCDYRGVSCVARTHGVQGQRHMRHVHPGVTFCPRKCHLFDFLESIRSQDCTYVHTQRNPVAPKYSAQPSPHRHCLPPFPLPSLLYLCREMRSDGMGHN